MAQEIDALQTKITKTEVQLDSLAKAHPKLLKQMEVCGERKRVCVRERERKRERERGKDYESKRERESLTVCQNHESTIAKLKEEISQNENEVKRE